MKRKSAWKRAKNAENPGKCEKKAEIANPFQKNLIDELQNSAKYDEITVEETVNEILQGLVGETWSWFSKQEPRIFKKIQRTFLERNPLGNFEEARVFFAFEGNSQALDFSCKHNNELLKSFYNKLVEILIGFKENLDFPYIFD